MKKLVALVLSLCLVFGMLAVASAEVKTGAAQGFGSEVKVTVTVEDGKITGLEVDDSGETYSMAGIAREDSVEKLIEAILAAGGTDGVDAKTGATFTSTAVIDAVNSILAGGEAGAAEGAPTFLTVSYACVNVLLLVVPLY